MVISSFFKRFTALFGATVLLNLIISSAVSPQAVTVDSAFAPILQDFGSTQNRASAKTSALQPDGKILVGGIFTVASGLPRSGVARFNADGTPDPTFDAGNIGVAQGLLTVTTGGTIEVIKVQTDGKIFIGGNFHRDEENINKAIERLNADGSRDTSFQSSIINAGIGDIEIQTNGKIVVGGNFQITATNPANGQTVIFRHLARLNTDGSFDFSFAGNGAENSDNIVIQPDGKIVVGNRSTSSAPNQLVRYNSNGTIDTVLTELDDWVSGLEFCRTASSSSSAGLITSMTFSSGRIARLNSNGTRDTTFASTIQFVNSLYFCDVRFRLTGNLSSAANFHLSILILAGASRVLILTAR